VFHHAGQDFALGQTYDETSACGPSIPVPKRTNRRIDYR
jgi:hypothetical protein